jgi:hypothetical protein
MAVRWAAVLLIACAVPSCKKSSGSGSNNNGGNGSYYMKFKLNGVQVEYDSQPVALISFNSANNLYTAALLAYKDVNAGLVNAVTMTVMSNTAFAAGASYNDPAKATVNGSMTPETTILYYDAGANGYITLGALADASGNVPLPGVVANAKLTITELTATYLKGTFSGTVYKSSDLQQVIQITEGQLYLKRGQ